VDWAKDLGWVEQKAQAKREKSSDHLFKNWEKGVDRL